MTTATLPAPPPAPGRTFMGPVWDYLLIAAAPSLALFLLLRYGQSVSLFEGWAGQATAAISLPVLLLACGQAHFAASTVRLYTKPNAFRDHPFATMVLPLLALAAVTLAVAFAPVLGKHLWALYLTWSPYHYAAQAYGLALMYCFRSGRRLSEGNRRLLRASCLAPFFYTVIHGVNGGLGWLLPESWSALARDALPLGPLGVICWALPALWLLRVWQVQRTAPPAISVLIVVANAMWWTTVTFLNAFLWATVFHAVQYLAIVTIAHVKDRLAQPGNAHGRLYHGLWFYGVCLTLAFALFHLWPMAYVRLGFGMGESMLMVTAIINVHHFVVDGYIWRLRKEGNRALVTAGA